MLTLFVICHQKGQLSIIPKLMSLPLWSKLLRLQFTPTPLSMHICIAYSIGSISYHLSQILDLINFLSLISYHFVTNMRPCCDNLVLHVQDLLIFNLHDPLK